jgi:hypothetical protein
MNHREMTQNSTTIAKKTYIKPMISKIRLVAEEAVLATCKTGVREACRPDVTCSRIRRS